MNNAEFLLTIGALLLAGLATDLLGKKTFLPRVTFLLIFGLFIGQEGLGMVPELFVDHFDLIGNMALLMIGFLLGGKMTPDMFRASGKTIILVSLSGALLTTLLVTIGMIAVGTAAEIALLAGCIASATAPAATVDAVLESGKDTPFTRILLSVVALDDIWGLLLFSGGLAAISAFSSSSGTAPLIVAVHDIGGSILLGICIGIPAAFLTGRINPGQPMLTEALGLVFLCGGLAAFFGVSVLLASMTMGMVIANTARHHEYPFHEIEGIEWPFMVIFFVLAGASLEFTALSQIGIAGGAYILLRTIGKISGSSLGATLSGSDPGIRSWIGAAMLPQAGAAMGMALVASTRFPQYRQSILALVISTTVIFELTGPLFTRLAIRRTSAKDI
ncbi:cation:proton antiporter [Prosthecochloris sp. ZM_2]|uniref:cation:proton antiporter n=1 Tax=Prosthecochloris sp. ZM_2 TaxID=2045206 RepID=UPI000DF740EA|nr:cation:proton antiporter [Prosthecochloris sp. ZM_2]RNA65140.1 cation:proton antiporter [Prosthecochloris sp. ZM_2]